MNYGEEETLDQRRIDLAREEDRAEILALYRAQIGREFCPWTEHYPTDEEITFDLSRDALFVMREEGRIIAAVSLEEDPQVDALPCWTPELQPGGEIARVAVHPDFQNQGIARQMVQFGLDRLKERGYRSFHGIVNRLNEKALRSYAVFGFRKMGECEMYEQSFYCYELKL
jgi:ribosomal protein S18 acetylase RimI-like enzyme